MWKNASWVGLPSAEIRKKKIYENDLNGRFAYFRCEVNLPERCSLSVDISASSRYCLRVNGQMAAFGPCRGDRFRQYYETISLDRYLVEGRNIFEVKVLFTDPSAVFDQYEDRAPLFGNTSMPVRGHLMAVEGDILDQSGIVVGTLTTGKAEWNVCLDDSYFLLAGDDATANLGAVKENIDLKKQRASLQYQPADVVFPVIGNDFQNKVGILGPFCLKERDIPLPYLQKGEFSEETRGIFSKGYLDVKAGENCCVVLDAAVHTNAFLKFCFLGAEGAKVSILYAERYENAEGKCIARDDSNNGVLQGICDSLVLDAGLNVFEPFWYRTFRYIQITIQAENEAVRFYIPEFYRTGYPLCPVTKISSTDKWVEPLFEICERTLQNCMMETYMDCPYYEQMQYPMDTRLQMLFTYAVSRDTRLARKALLDFHSSMMPDGLILGKAPSVFPQMISTFSLYYIFALEEYYRQTGEIEVLRNYRSDVDAILEYYHRHIGADGLVRDLDYWVFVDWQDEWKDSMGTPNAAVHDASTIINLMYALALKKGANIFRETGRPAIAEEYLERSRAITERVRILCFDRQRGLLMEGPKTRQYSQHAQAWAVLNEMFTVEEAVSVLRNTLKDPDVIQASFSTGYEVIRAFEWAGIYEETGSMLARWIHLLDLHCTTCPEEPEHGRSECHAWSALPIYEFTRVFAGIKQKGTGWRELVIEPHINSLSDLRGEVVLPDGVIRFDYRPTEDWYFIDMPDGVSAEWRWPDGRCVRVSSGKTVLRRNGRDDSC